MNEPTGKQVGAASWQGILAWVRELPTGHYVITNQKGPSYLGYSAPNKEEVVVGPAKTMGGIFDELYVDSAKHLKVTKLAFINALEVSNQQSLLAAKRALNV